MAVRPHLLHERPGSPQVLARLPEVDALRRAGATKLAAAVRKAVRLKDECAAASAALNEARQAVRLAEQRDTREHAEALKRNVRATLESRHAAKAKTEVERAERRYAGLVLAVEQSADALYGTATDEAESVIAAARKTRERSVREIAEATERIVRAIDDAEAGLSLARWSSSPGDRRWRVALRTMELDHVRLDRLIAALQALPGAIGSQPLPDKEAEEPTITFGWSGIGAPQQPGSMHAS